MMPLLFFLRNFSVSGRDLVITDRDEHEYFAVQEIFYIIRHDRIHETGLSFESVVHVHEPEADDVALVAFGSNVFEINAVIAFKNFTDVIYIHITEMRYGNNFDVAAGHDRQRDDGMRYAAPLLDEITLMSDDVVSRDWTKNSNAFHINLQDRQHRTHLHYRPTRVSRSVYRACD